jgi:26S proteasome non-ATPase regulatory subunit 9
MDHARALMAEKEEIENKIKDLESVLKSQGVDMKSSLVDQQGFPRADIDIYLVRNTRAALARIMH